MFSCRNQSTSNENFTHVRLPLNKPSHSVPWARTLETHYVRASNLSKVLKNERVLLFLVHAKFNDLQANRTTLKVERNVWKVYETVAPHPSVSQPSKNGFRQGSFWSCSSPYNSERDNRPSLSLSKCPNIHLTSLWQPMGKWPGNGGKMKYEFRW